VLARLRIIYNFVLFKNLPFSYMKKLYLLSFLFFFAIISRAQNPALPNPGFESWHTSGNHQDPDSWQTLNDATGILGVFTATKATSSDIHSGTAAIKLQTKSVFGQIANGITTTGTLITTPPYGVTGGIPYTGRPDSIAGWYKCTPAGTDSGFVEFILKGHNNDSVGYVRFVTPNAMVSSYTRFSAKINYFSTALPDTAVWILSSSRGSGPVVNSILFVDDLQLIFNPVVCNAPTGLTTNSLTSTSIKLKWNAAANAVSYQQKYRVLGSPTWIMKTSVNANKPLSGLTPNTTYEWAVRSKCVNNPAVWSGWSSKKTFTTLTFAARIEADDDEATRLNDLTVYPNPAFDRIAVDMQVEKDEIMNLYIYNAIGQLVMSKKVTVDDGILHESLDVSSLRNGIYMITVNGSKVHSAKRLIIQ
jgi:hypothetical protein